jgi:hypothetical protein
MAKPFPSPRSAEPPWRYERKFDASAVPLAQVALILRLHPACFRSAFPSRCVNNLYLDQPDLRTFGAHVNGSMRREKLRVRWYGDAHGAVARPVLEVKRKRGQVGTKLRFPLPPFVYDDGFDWEKLRREVLERVGDAAVAEFVASAEPKLFNRYERDYLLSADGRFRLTVDRALQFARPRGQGARASTPARAKETVLELKYAVEDDADAQRIAARLPFRMGKYSKYLQGIVAIGGMAR